VTDRLSPISPAQAAEIALRRYGVSGTAKRLASEHDDTFRLAGADGAARLLKISVVPPALAPLSGGGDAAGGLGLQTALLLHLARVAPELPVQRVVATVDGRPEITLDGLGAEPRLVRLTSWLDGQLLGAGTSSGGLRREIGATLGRLNIALRGFDHPGARRTHRWDLQNFGALRPLLEQLPESGLLPAVGAALAASGLAASGLAAGGLRELMSGGLRAALADCLDRFDAVVRPALAGLPTQVIHTDFHGENLLTGGGRIVGILDFGDALAGPVALDVGVAACYQLDACGPGGDLLAPALDVVAGYHAVDPLSVADLDLVAEFIVARVAARIIVSQANAARQPANAGYLLRRTPQAVAHLAALRALPSDEIGRRLRAACRLEVVR